MSFKINRPLFSFFRIQRSVLALALFATCSFASAQDSFDFHAGDLLILQARPIQNAIGITAAQRAKMNGYADANRAKLEAYKQQLIKENKKAFDSKHLEAIELELKRKVFAELSPAQLKRLREISLQHDGIAALGDEGVAKRVGLSAQQLKTVRDVIVSDRKSLISFEQKAEKPIADKYKNIKPKNDADRKQLTAKVKQELAAAGKKYDPQVKAVVAADRKKIMDSLTPTQRATWLSLLGQPFKG